MKKRQKILAGLIVGVAAITIEIGVWNAVWQNRTQMREQMGNLKKDKSIKIELTKSEKDILKKISVDEAAIEQGMLLTWQKKLVRDMRTAEEALKTDYPSHSFQIVDGAASRTDTDMESTFWFVADGEETRYVLYLTEKDGKRTMRDTFLVHCCPILMRMSFCPCSRRVYRSALDVVHFLTVQSVRHIQRQACRLSGRRFWQERMHLQISPSCM